jgi:LysR family transcriptional regulator, cys regulon transcriptional activator
MKLQQLRFLVEVKHQGLNVSGAAQSLFTSQPGISKQIKLLEDELGVMVFERNGKRLTGITEAGHRVLEIAERMLRDAQNMKRVATDFAAEAQGSLTLATTHTQARYILPPVISDFVRLHPGIKLHVQQGSPLQVVEWLRSGEADLGIATEAIDQMPELVALPCYQWSHCVVVPTNHALCQHVPLTLEALAAYPLITYDATFTGRTRIDRAFAQQSLSPQVMLTAIDSDVIKTYVELGLGVGIIAEMAYDAQRDAGLVRLAANHLFDINTTRIGFRRDLWLRTCDFDLIERLSPSLSPELVRAAIRGAASGNAD